MAKKTIPQIGVPIMKSNGSMELAWYLFLQWLAENAGKTDLSDYFTKEEINALLDNVVHKSGNEEINGAKTFNTAPRLRGNLTPSTTATKPSTIEDALLSPSVNTSGIIDGVNIIRMQRTDGKREVRYRAGFRNSTNTGNLWPSVNVGVNPDDTTYVDLSTSNNSYNYAKTPTDSDAKDIQIATTMWAYKNRSTYTTNCITEIPQDINLTLSNGTLTLKAGSKVYVPNGAGNFDIRTVPTDKTTSEGAGTAQWLYTVSSGGNIFSRLLSNCTSGAGATATGGFAYDTTTNNIGYYNVSGVKQYSDISFPICICTSTNGVITSIDQVFNGIGYIGSSVYILPGVKCLAPYGRTANGTLRSYDWTCNSVIVRTETFNGKGMLAINCAQNAIGWADYVYNEKENYNYSSGTISNRRCLVGSMTIADGKIESLSIGSTFHAADFNKTANTDLSNLTNTGANISNWSSNVTNCITEIPQDINLTLTSAGQLRLLAGSKLYIPNGTNTFTPRTFDNDATRAAAIGTPCFEVALFNKSTLAFVQMFEIALAKACSGPTDTLSGTPYHLWYDTTNNLIKYYGSDGTTNSYYAALPHAIVTGDNSKITNINQIFNGLGYIGSKVFALPGVKGLIPNGRNTDGTLNNTAWEVNSVLTTSFSSNIVIGMRGNALGVSGSYVYDEEKNQNLNSGSYWNVTVIGKTLNDGTIVLKNKTFHAVDYNDIYTKTEADDNFVHKTGNETIDGEKTFLDVIRRRAALSGSDTDIYRLKDSNNKGEARAVAYYTGNQTYNRLLSSNTTSGKWVYLDIIAKDGGNGVVTLGGNVNNIENTQANETGSTSNVLATKGWANNTSSNISNIAHKTGNETIAGVKKFTSEIAGTIAAYTATNANSAAAPYKKIMECVLTGAYQTVIIPFLYTRTSTSTSNATYAGKISLRTESTAGTLSTSTSGIVLSTFPNDIQDGNYRFYVVYKNNYPETNKVTCQIWVYVKQTYAGVSVTPIRFGRGSANYSNDSFLTWGNNMDQQAALPSGYSSISQTTVITYAKASDAANSILTTVAKNKAQNGYFKLGNGLIIQWGEIPAEQASAQGTVTLPTAFTTTNYTVCINQNTDANQGSGYIHRAYGRTTTSFAYRRDVWSSNYNPTTTKSWIAIGY